MKYVLVTGANGGMGRAVVENLKRAGFAVIALDKKVEENDTENVVWIQTDLTSETSVNAAFDKVKEITDNLYGILHFAGIYALDSLVEIGEERFKRIFDVNVFGVYRINKIFLPLMQAGSRIIIATSELAPLAPLPFTGLYAVTKSALDKYAYALRMELQLLNISVAVLRPGAVNTDMLGASTSDLNTFCNNSKLYTCNAARFKAIVDRVEARHIPAEKIARKTLKILKAKRLKQVYSINRNPLLLILNMLPKRLQTWIIKVVLKTK